MDIKAIMAGLAFALMWSSAFTSARIIVTHAPALAASSLRFTIAGIIGVTVARAMGQSFALTRNQWRTVLIFGFCQNAIYLGFNFVAMRTIEASLASIIASTMPLIVAFIGWTVLGNRLPLQSILGLVGGFAGVALIMSGRIGGGADPIGLTLCVLGALALAIATLTVRSGAGGNMMMVVGLQMFVGAFVLGIASPFVDTYETSFTPSLVIAFAYTVIVPGIIATLVWFWLVHRIGAVKAAAFHFLNPFLGVAIAAVILGERVTLSDFIGVAVIMAGILAVQTAKARATP